MVLKSGDIVRFTGCTEEQRRWGNHSPADKLVVGELYMIDTIDVKEWHTKLTLKNVNGSFNSVCFRLFSEVTVA